MEEEKKSVPGYWRIVALAAICACVVFAIMFATKPSTEQQAPANASNAAETESTEGEGTEGASLTLFILPVDNASALKLRLTSKEDDGTKTSAVSLTKNGQPFVFEAGKKYRINGFKAPGSSWKIFIATDIMNVENWGDPVDTEIIVE